MKKRSGLVMWAVAALLAFVAAPAWAQGVDSGGGQCDWRFKPVTVNVNADGDNRHSVLYQWQWWYGAVAGPYYFDAELAGETGWWGFPSVSKSNSGDGHFIVERHVSCIFPSDDIRASGKNQFTAEAVLNADEVARAIGSMRMWFETVRSHRARGGTFDCHAAGGAEATANGRGGAPSGTVSIGWGGIGVQVPLSFSSGGSASTIYNDHDAGSGGKSPEYVDFLTKSEVTLDLDSFDYGWAKILNARSQLRIVARCFGFCGHEKLVHEHSSY